jgi:hypothetical protein
MTNLVGLAFTSPQIALMVCDRTRFRVHYYQNRPNELHAFLQEKDARLSVVIVKSVRDLNRVKEVEGIHAMMLFDDPEVMSRIDGIKILDAETDDEYAGYKKKVTSSSQLNAALLKKGVFSLGPKALTAIRSLSKDITLRELVRTVTGKKKVPEDFLENICLYLAGTLQKRSWVARVQKPGLSSGISVEKMAELEKFIEQSPSGEMLWRAFYEINEAGVPLRDASDQFEADEDDLKFLVATLGEREGLHYYRNPRTKPLVVKKKRKRRKLTEGQSATKKVKQRGGPTITSTVDTKMLAEALEDRPMDDSGFDLAGTLNKIDEASSGGEIPYAFSRMACARLCGLVKARPYNTACKQAVLDGADKKDVASIREYIKANDEAKALWRAYCRASYFVGVSVGAASKEFGVSPHKLKAVLAYKPMAYVFEFVAWPKQLE